MAAPYQYQASGSQIWRWRPAAFTRRFRIRRGRYRRFQAFQTIMSIASRSGNSLRWGVNGLFDNTRRTGKADQRFRFSDVGSPSMKRRAPPGRVGQHGDGKPRSYICWRRKKSATSVLSCATCLEAEKQNQWAVIFQRRRTRRALQAPWAAYIANSNAAACNWRSTGVRAGFFAQMLDGSALLNLKLPASFRLHLPSIRLSFI